jgi:hypothetical protein
MPLALAALHPAPQHDRSSCACMFMCTLSLSNCVHVTCVTNCGCSSHKPDVARAAFLPTAPRPQLTSGRGLLVCRSGIQGQLQEPTAASAASSAAAGTGPGAGLPTAAWAVAGPSAHDGHTALLKLFRSGFPSGCWHSGASGVGVATAAAAASSPTATPTTAAAAAGGACAGNQPHARL